MFGSVSASLIIKIIALHFVLALAMDRVPQLATLHALLVVLLGCWWAATEDSLEWACCASAYVAGSEVLWRMMHASVFWEFGKYACCAIWLIALWRREHRIFNGLAGAYFALLLPSVALTLGSLDLSRAREEISFNLSGPLCLTIGVWFFTNVTGRLVRLDRVLLAIMAPAASTALITAYRTVTATSIRFGGNSNFTTSGGFGPNQVAAVLGLATFVTSFWLVAGKPRLPARFVLIVLLLMYAVQSAMTYSRGGLYGAAGALIFASIYLLRDAKQRTTLLVTVPAICLLIGFVVLPQLDEFTDGTLSARFRQTRLTHRDDIIAGDLRVWAENPIFGVGPGMAKYARALSFTAAAHTEISRLLSEHGAFGVIALLLLLAIAKNNLAAASTTSAKAFVLGATAWCFLFMLANGMRLAAPAFVFALGCATWSTGRVRTQWRVVTSPSSPRAIPVEIAMPGVLP